MESSKSIINDDWVFERFNSKYNRLWSQITACSSLLIQIIAGYVFAMMAIQVLQPPTLVYSLLFVASRQAKTDHHRSKTDGMLAPFGRSGRFSGPSIFHCHFTTIHRMVEN